LGVLQEKIAQKQGNASPGAPKFPCGTGTCCDLSLVGTATIKNQIRVLPKAWTLQFVALASSKYLIEAEITSSAVRHSGDMLFSVAFMAVSARRFPPRHCAEAASKWIWTRRAKSLHSNLRRFPLG
jgi:hypothetical protein